MLPKQGKRFLNNDEHLLKYASQFSTEDLLEAKDWYNACNNSYDEQSVIWMSMGIQGKEPFLLPCGLLDGPGFPVHLMNLRPNSNFVFYRSRLKERRDNSWMISAAIVTVGM